MSTWPKVAVAAFVGAFALYHATKPDRIEPAATQQMPQASASSEEQMALLLNMGGHLCASVTSIRKASAESVYEVECIAARGGAATAAYLVDMRTGRASRI